MQYEEEAEAFKERNYRQKEKVCPWIIHLTVCPIRTMLRWAGLEDSVNG